MRILFHGPSVSSTRPMVSLSFLTGITSAKYVDDIENLRLAFNLTGNTGNMIHAEAPLKFLDYNFTHSAITDIHRLFSSYKNETEFFIDINKNFDCVVLSLANLIRPDFNTNLHEIVDGLTIPFYVLGVGLQNDVNFTSLRPNTQKLLQVFNSKASLFGVRGLRTEKWLHDNGFNNAIALGCPSLYVYPEFIIKRRELPSEFKTVMTAGHLSDHYLNRDNDKRVEVMWKVLKNFPSTSYVFQDEPFTYKEILDAKGLWQENISQFNRDIINSYLSLRLNKIINFRNYYMFFSADTWRATCSTYDLFIGDRLHAGIAAHQSGIPSIILYDDMRVKELSDFYNFPALSVDEFLEGDIHDLVATVLSDASCQKFIKTYLERYYFFVSKLESLGLKVKNKRNIIDFIHTSVAQKVTYENDSIIDRATFLKNSIRNDGAVILFSNALEFEGRTDECWKLLIDENKQLESRSALYNLFVIEKSIQFKKEFPIDSILSKLTSCTLNRSEHKKLSEILNSLEKSNIVSYDTISKILQHEHADTFDACVKHLINLGFIKQAIEILSKKIQDGKGTRVRVNFLISLLLQERRYEEAMNALNENSHYLSNVIVDKFSKQINDSK